MTGDIRQEKDDVVLSQGEVVRKVPAEIERGNHPVAELVVLQCTMGETGSMRICTWRPACWSCSSIFTVPRSSVLADLQALPVTPADRGAGDAGAHSAPRT